MLFLHHAQDSCYYQSYLFNIIQGILQEMIFCYFKFKVNNYQINYVGNIFL